MPGTGAVAVHQSRLLSIVSKLDELDQRRAGLVQDRDAAIAALSAAGLSFSEIAKACGLTRGRVGQIVQRQTGA